ncbi:MAG: amino acid ABC transporter substrate-binding protein [Lachnospiraceae bacterium]|nr:amino acid ABC transporter substrate-binding protein [Lachnospiraceae bacterium]
MKKKLIAATMAAAMALSMTMGTVSMAEEMTTFTVGFDAEYPPYGYMDDDGEYTGFDLELAQAVCDLLGWELVKTPIDWDAKDMELESGAIDCIWSGFTINGREDDYAWSYPYVDNSQVIVVSEESGITSLDDLAGKIVGVQAASAALELLSDGGDQADLAATFGTLQEFADYNTAFVELQAGSIDAVAMDIGVAQYQIKEKEGYLILDEELNSEQYGIGFRTDDEELRDTVNEALLELVADGTVDELAEKYELGDMVCLGDGIIDEAETEAETEAVTE